MRSRQITRVLPMMRNARPGQEAAGCVHGATVRKISVNRVVESGIGLPFGTLVALSLYRERG